LGKLEGEIKNLEEDLVDANAQQKKGLSTQLATLREDRDSLAGSIRVLSERRKASYLGIYEAALAKIKAEGLDHGAIRAEIAKSVDAAMRNKRLFMKNNAAGLNRQEREAKLIELDEALARSKSLANNWLVSSQRIKNSIRRAEADLELAKAEIQKPNW